MESVDRIVAVLPGDGSIKIENRPIPELSKGMVKIAVKSSLVSPGTELGGWDTLAELRAVKPDTLAHKTFGYSVAGTVLEVGDGVVGYEKGQRVAAIGAGYAQHTNIAVVPQNLCISIPEEVNFDDASYSMLLATGLQAVRRGSPAIGESWLVVGLGLVGLLTARLLQLNGCRVAGIDSHKFRVDLAKDWGIDHCYLNSDVDLIAKMKKFSLNEGFDGAVLAFGGEADAAMDMAVELMKVSPDGHSEGTIVTVGWPRFSYTGKIGHMNNINLVRASRTGPGYHDDEWERSSEDYSSVFVRWTTKKNLRLCLDLVADKQIDVQKLTTHSFPLREVEKSISEVIDNPEEMLGVIFTND